MVIQFWSNDLTILFNKDYMLELWPTDKMTYEQKMNAISRLIVLLTILGFIFTRNIRILLVGIITVSIIFILYNVSKNKERNNKYKDKENFENCESSLDKENVIINPETLEKFLKSDFKANNSKNPFSNVLLTEIGDDPDRNAAPPAFNPNVYEDITNSVKKMVQDLNPDIKDTDKQLFGDLGENFYLDQSNRNFYSTANTRVSNDQGAFAKYLYGDMPSCRGGDAIACVQDNIRYNLY